MPVTINPFPKIKPGNAKKIPTQTIEEVFRKRLSPKSKLEASGHNAGGAPITTSPGNPFVVSAGLAYKHHLPFVFGPDEVWLCISQGLATHINLNAEELRHHFVQHEGKKEITVRRDDFVRGNPDNPWSEVFDQFIEQIQKHLNGPKHELILSDFSTTGPIEKAASAIVLMDAMQQYFTYSFRTASGFSRITVLGKLEDWQKIRDRVKYFDEFGLSWWSTGLLSVLDNIIITFKAPEQTTEFWRSFYRENGGSGGPYVDGWINQFFPYLESRKGSYQNPKVLNPKSCYTMTGTHTDFASGLASAPFTWKYYADELPYRFVGGLVATAILEDGALQPVVGWGVVDETENQ